MYREWCLHSQFHERWWDSSSARYTSSSATSSLTYQRNENTTSTSYSLPSTQLYSPLTGLSTTLASFETIGWQRALPKGFIKKNLNERLDYTSRLKDALLKLRCPGTDMKQHHDRMHHHNSNNSFTHHSSCTDSLISQCHIACCLEAGACCIQPVGLENPAHIHT